MKCARAHTLLLFPFPDPPTPPPPPTPPDIITSPSSNHKNPQNVYRSLPCDVRGVAPKFRAHSVDNKLVKEVVMGKLLKGFRSEPRPAFCAKLRGSLMFSQQESSHKTHAHVVRAKIHVSGQLFYYGWHKKVNTRCVPVISRKKQSAVGTARLFTAEDFK